MSRKAFLFGLLVAMLLVVGLYRAKDGARQSSAEIVRLEAEISEAYRQKALLEAELAHMSRREWIEEYAREKLGMAPARANQIATEFNLDVLVGEPLRERPATREAGEADTGQ
ncbi:MAG: septum formation initiator family protein [Pseudomonadota bacterium]